MSVWKRFHAHGLPSFITTNLEKRRPLLSAERPAQMLLDVVKEVRRETEFKLLAFVIMPDHMHLVLALPPDLRLGRVMQLIKGRFSNRYNELVGGGGRLWQERYHERALRTEAELVAAIEYVHRNPVAAGLVSEAEDFSWSSANQSRSTDLQRYLSG